MSSDWSEFLSRDELLGGLPARRASTLLFAIESRTAHLVARSRRAMAGFLTEKTAEARERAFLDALAQGRDLPLQPAIQDLERYAPVWASLVPDDPGIRAALARMLGEKYIIPERQTPALRQALGLDDEAVRAAFQRLHQRPLTSIYADRLSWPERLRWVRAEMARWLESLPPFWTAFALTLTETVGAGILALPIAFAAVGPVAGLVILLVLGLVNILTIGAMAEAVARNGNVRYGQAYFGRLVNDYLGRAGSLVLTPALLTLNVITLLAYYVGLGTTLKAATGIPAAVWVALVFLVGVAVLHRETLDATVASALVVGAASICLIVLLSVLALPHVSGANLRHAQIPFRGGAPFDASILELIFGVVLLAFFGHTSAANCAAVVLRQDPSARGLIRGSMAALAAALGLYCLWIVAVNGALGVTPLAGQSGTALVPLAKQVGPSVDIFGSIFVVLAMGMASIHISLGLYNRVREWLPDERQLALKSVSRQSPSRRGDLRGWLRGRHGRFTLGMAPVVATFLAVEALVLTDRESFAGPLGFLGVITAPVVAGMFSMLMLLAARRKGDCAVGPTWRILGNPILVATMSLLFWASIVVHGLVIWEKPYQRVAAILVAVVMIGVMVVFIRRGAFARRTVVEVRVDRVAAEPLLVNVIAFGERETAAVQVSDDGGASTVAAIELPATGTTELKIWAHRLTPEGVSEGLPGRAALVNGHACEAFDLEPATGQRILPFAGTPARLEISLPLGAWPEREPS